MTAHDMLLTDEELAAIEARANAAMSGPWKKRSQRYQATRVTAGREVVCLAGRSADVVFGRRMHDETMEFIAHARRDIPRLLAEVRRLRAMLTSTDEASEERVFTGMADRIDTEHLPRGRGTTFLTPHLSTITSDVP
jgi:hypothetical protein